jgi:hypothetical protein
MDDYGLHITLYSYISDQRHSSNQLMYFRPKAKLKPLQKTLHACTDLYISSTSNAPLHIIKLQKIFVQFSAASRGVIN